MKPIERKRLGLSGLAMLWGMGAWAIPVHANPLQGANPPTTIAFKKLDRSWRKLAIGGQFEMGDLLKSWSGFFGTPSYDNVYYTKGDLVTLGSETYLVAYRVPLQGEPVNVMGLASAILGGGKTCETVATLTPETSLSLALLNLKTIGSLNDIQPIDVNAEIAQSQDRAQKQKESCDAAQAQEEKNEEERSGEAPDVLDSFNRAQQDYFLKNGRFATTLGDLDLNQPEETDAYIYRLETGKDAVYHRAIAKNNNDYSYVGGVFVYQDPQTKKRSTETILCEADEAGKPLPALPTLEGSTRACGEDSYVYE